MLPDGLPNAREALATDGFDAVKLRKCLSRYQMDLREQTDLQYNHYDTPMEWLQARDVQEAVGVLISLLPL